MIAKDIRWSALKNEFDAEKFRLAVTKGQDIDGTKMNTDCRAGTSPTTTSLT